jgi:hypothetical protein
LLVSRKLMDFPPIGIRVKSIFGDSLTQGNDGWFPRPF